MSSLLDLVSVSDFRKEAEELLPRSVKGFLNDGSENERTLIENSEAFKRFYIRPRVLVDVSGCDLTTSVLGHRVQIPFGVAPMGFQSLAHHEGERAIARATARIGTVYTLSTVSTSTPEEVAAEGALNFFQLYVFKERNIAKALVKRAEKAGFKAIVLTIDVPMLGTRYGNLRNKFKAPNHFSEFEKKKEVQEKGLSEQVNSLHDPSLTWKDIAWLKSITLLPIILKGIMTPEDALKGVDAGISAIWVSNHGGRQLDGTFPTIEVLPKIVSAVGQRTQVYVDGGFRSGSDIFKALALGANMVFLGRPLMWGLACGGAEGAYKVLKLLQEELHNVMALSGISSVDRITANAIERRITSML